MINRSSRMYLAIHKNYNELTQALNNFDFSNDGNHHAAREIYRELSNLLLTLYSLSEMYDYSESKTNRLTRHLLYQGALLLQYLNKLEEAETLLIQFNYLTPNHKIFPQARFAKLNYSVNLHAEDTSNNLHEYLKIALVIINSENIGAYSLKFIREIFTKMALYFELPLELQVNQVTSIPKDWKLHLFVGQCYLFVGCHVKGLKVLQKAASIAPTLDALKMNLDQTQFYFDCTYNFLIMCLEYPNAENLIFAKSTLQKLSLFVEAIRDTKQPDIHSKDAYIKLQALEAKLWFITKQYHRFLDLFTDTDTGLKTIEKLHAIELLKEDAYFLLLLFCLLAHKYDSQYAEANAYYDLSQKMLITDFLDNMISQKISSISKTPILIIFALEVILGKTQLSDDMMWLPELLRTADYSFDDTTDTYLAKKLMLLLYLPFENAKAEKIITTLYPDINRHAGIDEIAYLYNEVKVKYSFFQRNLHNSLWHKPTMISAGDIDIQCVDDTRMQLN